MSDILDKKLRVTMPDGSKWDVPVRVIAENRAQYYVDIGEFVALNESLDETTELFESDDYEIDDWAANNMNWDDVKDKAVQVQVCSVDYQEGWCNGEKEVVD